MPVDPRIDAIPEGLQYSLDRFVNIATALKDGMGFNVNGEGLGEVHETFEAQRRFMTFVLTGIHPDSGQQVYVSLDEYRSTLHDDTLDIFQDYDSLLVISDTLPYYVAIGLKTCPEAQDTLTKDLKLRIQVRINGKLKKKPLSWIPNFGFGSAGNRHLIRIFLPAKYEEDKTVSFSAVLAQRLYDEVTVPTLCDIFPEHMSHYPASHWSEMYRTRRRLGAVVRTMHDIPVFQMTAFCTEFIRRLNTTDFGEGAFFLHQIRGVKGHGHFRYGDRDMAAEVLGAVTQVFDDNQLGPQIRDGTALAFIDVGFEVGLKGYVTIVKKSAHKRILRKFYSISDEEACNEMMKTTRRFESDSAAMLNQAAGVRYTTGGTGSHDIQFLNVYHTEKEPTYLVDLNHFAKFMQPTDILHARMEGTETLAHLESTISVFLEAGDNAPSYPARIEPRLPWCNMLDFDMGGADELEDQFLKSITYLVPMETWWTFKAWRQLAIKYCFDWILMSPVDLIGTAETLTLIALLTYMSNALCARPEMGNKYEDLRWAALRHAFDEDEGEVAVNPYGLFFVRDIDFQDECPFLGDGRVVQGLSLARLFGKEDLQEVIDIIQPVVLDAPGDQPHPLRIRNKQARTGSVIYRTETAQPIFDLESQGITLPVIGATTNVFEGLAIEGYNMEEQRTDHIASKIWKQLFKDLGQKFWTTTKQGSEPYVILNDRHLREGITEEFFMERELAKVFRVVGFKQSSIDHWRTNFDHMFPPDGYVLPTKKNMQNWRQMVYWVHYMRIHNLLIKQGNVGKANLIGFRRALKMKYDLLIWMPYVERGRCMLTKTDTRNDRVHPIYPVVHKTAAPVIMVNPVFVEEVRDLLFVDDAE